MKPCIKCESLERYKSGVCKICHRAISRTYRIANPEKVKAAGKTWRIANPEKVKASSRAHRIANPEKAKAARAAWGIANPEKLKTGKRAWQVANLEKRRIYGQNYRASKIVNGGILSKDLAKKLYKRQKGKCICCCKPLGNNFNLDHIIPLSLGGRNEDCNIQLLRASCNFRKGAKHPIVYMQERGFLL